MDINIIISGNLTGFSRFYASPGAADLYAEAKFDFDYRNYLTFLNGGEKAYAVSFSPNVMAVSIITRILDSFRRPGILVVSVLLQRKFVVESVMNPEKKGALWQLLNALNDKFYERNFMNGMINQNAAVLMQDYYTDILSQYKLVHEGSQRSVNWNIDANTVNKKIGFVAAAENEMENFLAAIYRKSYEGYHHVFFAPNAPKNIEEPPVEIVTYRVLVTNNNRTLPMVRLTDRIPLLGPERGEIAFEQNFTYADVIQGNARQVSGVIDGETIKLTYRFEKEKKTINFKFQYDGIEVPFQEVMPSIELSNEAWVNLPNGSYLFEGTEIYGVKRLKSNSSHYAIKKGSDHLNLAGLSDGDTAYIQLEKCSQYNFIFPMEHSFVKTVKLRHRIYGIQEHTVRDRKSIYLPGNLEDWEYTIEMEHYQTVKGYLSANDIFRLPLTPKNTTATIGGSGRNTVTVQTGSLSNGNRVVQKASTDNKPKKGWLISILAILILAGVGVGVYEFFPTGGDEDNKSGEAGQETGKQDITKVISFKLYDASKNPKLLTGAEVENWINAKFFKLTCEFGGNKQDADVSDPKTTFRITAKESSSDIVQMSIHIDNIEIADTTFIYSELSNGQEVKVMLNVLRSDIELYADIADKKSEMTTVPYQKWKSLEDRLKSQKRINNSTSARGNLIKHMSELVSRISHEECESGEIPQTGTSEKEKVDTSILDKWDISDAEIKTWEEKIKKDKDLANQEIGGSTVKNRVEALRKVINYIKKGKRPSVDKLSEDQKNVIKAIFDAKYENEKRKIISVQERLEKSGESFFRNVTSLKSFKDAIKGLTTVYNSIEWPDFTKND